MLEEETWREQIKDEGEVWGLFVKIYLFEFCLKLNQNSRAPTGVNTWKFELNFHENIFQTISHATQIEKKI